MHTAPVVAFIGFVQIICTYACTSGSISLESRVEKEVLKDLRERLALHSLKQLSSSFGEEVGCSSSTSVKNPSQRCKRRRRPFVTLSYAQSLDGSIAAEDKQPVRISGEVTSVMTHGLRSLHSAILVGSGTVFRDNPRLNVREWRGTEVGDDSQPPCPRPIFLSSQLSLPLRLNARNAIILTDFTRTEPWRWVSSRGADGVATDCLIYHCATGTDGYCCLEDCLERLYAMGFDSVMVEGGGRIISAFLRSGLVDRVIITVAPLMLGGYGLPLCGRDNICRTVLLEDVRYALLGDDVVLMATPRVGTRGTYNHLPHS